MVRPRFIPLGLLLIAGLSFLLAFACGDDGKLQVDRTAEPKGRIAFATNVDGNAEIYIMNADGSQPVNITNSETDESEPTWSPDGTRLAFTSSEDGAGDIFSIAADGSDRQQLTEGPAIDSTARWSPDGKHIAFYSARRQGDGFLWLMSPDGSGVRTLLSPEAFADPRTPCHAVTPGGWLPDGERLVFQGSAAETRAIKVCAVNLDGTDLEVIRSDEEVMNVSPAVSPDGRHIAFSSNRDDNLEIYVMNADGGHLRRLTDHPGRDDQPTWSPDGQWIAFSSTRDGIFEIYIMRADGSDLRRLTDNKAIDADPAWSPR